MHTQIFQLNIPAHLTRDGRPDREVLVKTLLHNNGDHYKTEFIDVDTHLMISVIDWYEVYKSAIECSKKLWKEHSNTLADVAFNIDGGIETIYTPEKYNSCANNYGVII